MDTQAADIKAMLDARPRWMTYERISRETGLGYHWLTKLASGAIQEPGADKAAVLRQYLETATNGSER